MPIFFSEKVGSGKKNTAIFTHSLLFWDFHPKSIFSREKKIRHLCQDTRPPGINIMLIHSLPFWVWSSHSSHSSIELPYLWWEHQTLISKIVLCQRYRIFFSRKRLCPLTHSKLWRVVFFFFRKPKKKKYSLIFFFFF